MSCDECAAISKTAVPVELSQELFDVIKKRHDDYPCVVCDENGSCQATIALARFRAWEEGK